MDKDEICCFVKYKASSKAPRSATVGTLGRNVTLLPNDSSFAPLCGVPSTGIPLAQTADASYRKAGHIPANGIVVAVFVVVDKCGESSTTRCCPAGAPATTVMLS